MVPVPQSTALVVVFKAFLASDHVSEATGKTIVITISKAGGAFGNPNAGATNATEISSGWYKVTLDTTDTGTLGILAIRGAVATIDDYGDRFFVVKATNGGLTALPDTAVTTNASLITAGTGTSQLSVTSGRALSDVDTIKTNPVVNGGTITFPTNSTVASTTNITAGTIATATAVTTVNGLAAGVITATSIAADAITAAKVAADVSAEIADAVWDEDATGHQTGGTFGQAIGDPGLDTTTIYQSVVTDAAGTNVAADIIAIKAETASILTDTAEIGAAGAGLTNINLPDQTMNITGNITGNLSGSVGSVTGLTFTVAGQVDANIQSVNDVAVTGTGAVGDEWGP